MSQTPAPRPRLLALVPRFGLRTLFVAVFVIAALVEIGLVTWPKLVRYFESRQYAALQAGKQPFVLEQRRRQAADGSHSSTVDDGRPIPDGFAVLVRQGDTFGCFIPRNQWKKGESLEYDWYYRSDGLGPFSTDDPNVQSGHSFAGPYVSGQGPVKVKFGPFDLEWSGNEPGWGYVYYCGDFSGNARAPDLTRICTTTYKTVRYLNARSAEWLYKANADDPGLRGDADPAEPRFNPSDGSPHSNLNGEHK
jgi:hypothetical protein